MADNRGKQWESRFKEDFINSFPNGTIDRLYDTTNGFKAITNISDFIGYNYPNIYYLECKSHKGSSFPFSELSQYDKLIALEVDLDTDLFSYYDLSDIDISSINVSKTETVEDQSNSGKRPRFSIDTEIINKFGLKPFAIYNIKKEEFIYRDKSYWTIRWYRCTSIGIRKCWHRFWNSRYKRNW